MAEDQASQSEEEEKTENPTPRRKEKAREEGNVPVSKEWFHAYMVWSMLLLCMFHYVWGRFYKNHLTAWFFQRGASIRSFMLQSFLPFAWFGILLWLGILGTGLVQGQFIFSRKRLVPKFSNLSPLTNFKKIFSLGQVLMLVKHAGKIIGLLAAALFALYPFFQQLLRIGYASAEAGVFLLNQIMIRFLWTAALLCTFFFLLDYGYQWFSWIKKMRMSREELKNEFKEMEGDPHFKGHIKGRRRALLEASLKEVSHATVVVTNPTHYAVALSWNSQAMDAPKVVAKGVDFWAQQIRRVAGEHHIPLWEDKKLARLLYQHTKLGDPIPPHTYAAVATVIRYILGIR